MGGPYHSCEYCGVEEKGDFRVPCECYKTEIPKLFQQTKGKIIADVLFSNYFDDEYEYQAVYYHLVDTHGKNLFLLICLVDSSGQVWPRAREITEKEFYQQKLHDLDKNNAQVNRPVLQRKKQAQNMSDPEDLPVDFPEYIDASDAEPNTDLDEPYEYIYESDPDLASDPDQIDPWFMRYDAMAEKSYVDSEDGNNHEPIPEPYKYIYEADPEPDDDIQDETIIDLGEKIEFLDE